MQQVRHGHSFPPVTARSRTIWVGMAKAGCPRHRADQRGAAPHGEDSGQSARPSQRHKQLQKESLEKPTRMNTFQWDYSYISWKDWPVELRSKHVMLASIFGRTWVYSRTKTYLDVPKRDAREMYNQNVDGCPDRWKENYRKRKRRIYTDR